MTTFIYDSNGRVARTVTSSSWTPEDHALAMAYKEYKASLCPGCGHPKATAWHHRQDEEAFKLEGDFVCWGCTAAQPKDANGKRPLKRYPAVVDTRDYEQRPLPPGPPLPQDVGEAE